MFAELSACDFFLHIRMYFSGVGIIIIAIISIIASTSSTATAL
jgi:hypothetical protein